MGISAGISRCRGGPPGGRGQRLLVGAALAIVGIHAALLGWGAWIHSPCWDELGHLPSGLTHWRSGRFELYQVNPPLVRMVAVLPLLGRGLMVACPEVRRDPRERPEWECARNMVRACGHRVFWYFTLARWACLPFSLLGAWVCWRWACDLHGSSGGLVALVLWCFSPTILGHGQLITPDTACAALGVGASYVFWRWVRKPAWPLAAGSGAVLGAAALTKFTWVTLFALWPLVWLLSVTWRRTRQPLGAPAVLGSQSSGGAALPEGRAGMQAGLPGAWPQSAQLVALLSVAICVINLGYGGQDTGRAVRTFDFLSRPLRGPVSGEARDPGAITGNRLASTPLGSLPVPLPAGYLLGIDRQMYDFEIGLPSYLRGQWRERGWWYYYLYALAIKEPLGTWALLGLAAAAWVWQAGFRLPWRDELALGAPAAMVLALVSSQTGFSHHMRYVLPVLPFTFVWVARLARSLPLGHRVLPAVAGCALLWSVASSCYYYPHSLSYFNEVVGGPRHGHEHLLDSNIDWGQDLLLLERWLQRHPEARPIGLAYSLPQWLLDPADVGIDYRVPPAGPTRDGPFHPTGHATGPLPGWYAVFVRQLHERHGMYDYFRRFEPVVVLGYTVYIYHITVAEADRVRADLGLPAVADVGMEL